MGSHNRGEHPELHDVVLRVFLLNVLIVSLCVKRRPGKRAQTRSARLSTKRRPLLTLNSLEKRDKRPGYKHPSRPPHLQSSSTRSVRKACWPGAKTISCRHTKISKGEKEASSFLLLFFCCSYSSLCVCTTFWGHSYLLMTHAKVLGRSETEQSEI